MLRETLLAGPRWILCGVGRVAGHVLPDDLSTTLIYKAAGLTHEGLDELVDSIEEMWSETFDNDADGQ